MLEWMLANLSGTALAPIVLGLSFWLYKTHSNLEELREWQREHEKEVTMALQEFTAYKTNQENLEDRVNGLQLDIKDALDKINNKLDLLNQKVWSLGKA